MAFLLVLGGMLCYQTDDSAQQLEFLRLSYRANKDAFAYGSFRFEFTKGSSASFSDAESEVFTRSFREDGLYAFDGGDARYDLIADPKDLAAATKRISDHRRSAFIRAFRSVTDGKLTLRDNLETDQTNTSLRHSPIIFPGTDTFYKSGAFEFPLYLGDNCHTDPDLFQDLTSVQDGKVSLAELDMDSRLDEVKVCKFSFTWADGKRTYWIDIARGSVPLRILDHYNPNSADIVYIFRDLEHVANVGWLPRRRLHIIGQGGLVDRIVVTEIDTKNKPGPAVFQLEFPEPISVFDTARKLVYPRRKVWSLRDLPQRSSPGVRPVSPYTRPPEMPAEVVPVSWWTVILSAVAILLVTAVPIVVLRRRMGGPRGV